MLSEGRDGVGFENACEIFDEMKESEDNLQLLTRCRQALLDLGCSIRVSRDSGTGDKHETVMKALKDGSPVEVLIRDGGVELLTAPDDPCFRRRFFDLVSE